MSLSSLRHDVTIFQITLKTVPMSRIKYGIRQEKTPLNLARRLVFGQS